MLQLSDLHSAKTAFSHHNLKIPSFLIKNIDYIQTAETPSLKKVTFSDVLLFHYVFTLHYLLDKLFSPFSVSRIQIKIHN